jgi:hypothetical protein
VEDELKFEGCIIKTIQKTYKSTLFYGFNLSEMHEGLTCGKIIDRFPTNDF